MSIEPPDSPRRDSPAPAQRSEQGTALYVHLPFCTTKCPYCDFFSVADEGQDVDGMVAAILCEAEGRAPQRPRTVFLGGGTPSLLSVGQLARLLDRLDVLTDFRDSAIEVTAECNPESLDGTKARALLDLGVTRLSIGFQSLRDEDLQRLGRVHAAADSLRAFEAARSAGARDLNVDLIYALPDQTPEEWSTDLARVLDLEPQHLSAYNLTYEKDTLFHRWLEEGRLARAPEEVELECLEVTRVLTAAAGLKAYEISNHALPAHECRHNLEYWHNRPYVGLGPSAVSRVGSRRTGNVKGIATYRQAIDSSGQALGWSETLAPPARLAETWWLGLRLSCGVDPAEARRNAGFPGEDTDDPALAVAGRLLRTGHLEQQEGRWRLSATGLPLADTVAAELLAGVRHWAENRSSRADSGEPGR